MNEQLNGAREEAYYDAYWAAVSRILACDPKHKSAAIRMSALNATVDGCALVAELFATMDGERWERPASVSGGNWAWRSVLSRPDPQSLEVALERKVVELAGCEGWTYQMSTASGLHGPRSGRRRAIDLVRRHAPGHYSFIELKIDIDNPLYAAFEILGYGLAYLHARRSGQHGTGAQDVMSADRIDLVVLAPKAWYSYGKRMGGVQPFSLDALARAIDAGVASLASGGALAAPGKVRFRFEAFDHDSSIGVAAAKIIERF